MEEEDRLRMMISDQAEHIIEHASTYHYFCKISKVKPDNEDDVHHH